MTSDHYEEKYTDPELRRRLKDEILQADKGGEPGQWSARKSQLLVREYEKHGGCYKKSEKDAAARSLEEWTEQDWQTETGDDRARHGNTTERYLPKQVWDMLSEAEKAAAERTKEIASQQGEHHVAWTPAIKQAMEKFEAEFHQQHEPENFPGNDRHHDPNHSNGAKSEQQSDQSINSKTNGKLLQKSDNKKTTQVKQKYHDETHRSEHQKQNHQQAKTHPEEQQLSKQELYEQAKALNISGRSKMSRDQLLMAIQQQHGSRKSSD